MQTTKQTPGSSKRKQGEMSPDKSPPSKRKILVDHRSKSTIPNINQSVSNFIAVIHSLTQLRATQFPKSKVSRDIQKQAGNPKQVWELPGGDLKVECHSKTQFDKLLRLDLLAHKPVSVKQFSQRREQCKGVIYGIDLEVSLEDLKPKLANQGIVYSKRLLKNGNETTSVMVVLNGTKLPATIQLWLHNITVKPFYDTPKRCTNCQKFGHNTKICKAKIVCPKCSGSHDYLACTETKKRCANCKLEHSAAYKGCIAYKTAKTIEFLKADRGLSYAQAVREAKTTQKLTQSMAPKQVVECNKNIDTQAYPGTTIAVENVNTDQSITIGQNNSDNTIDSDNNTPPAESVTLTKLELLGFINIVINSVNNPRNQSHKADIIAHIAKDFLNWDYSPKQIVDWGKNPRFVEKSSTPVKVNCNLNCSI